MVTEATATSLLDKVGDFARTLDPEERELFAALIGPGVARALGAAEVEMFSAGQESDRLARALVGLAGGPHPAGVEDTGSTDGTGPAGDDSGANS
jgi:hypothetical protein